MLKRCITIIILLSILSILGKASAATFTVTTVNDSGPGSLREAISAANAASGPDTIIFNILPKVPQTIQLNQQLPVIMDPLVIDGWSQVRQGIVGIEIKGSVQVERIITFGENSDGSEIRGCAINSASRSGIEANQTSHISIYGNYIGLGLDGLTAYPNGMQGIYAKNVGWLTIGGSTADRQNIINHSRYFSIYAYMINDIVIKGNIVGLDKEGNPVTLDEQLSDGIFVSGNHAEIGGSLPEERNIIGSHTGSGITLEADHSKVINNYIGTNITGTMSRGNHNYGIHVTAKDVFIADNVISANQQGGVFIDGALSAWTAEPSFKNIKVMHNIIGLSGAGKWLGDPERDAKQTYGIKVDGSSQITIGDKNTISGNYRDGIHLELSATDVKIVSNLIGLSDNKNESYFPNGGDGIYTTASDIWIGGSEQEGNKISNNMDHGVSVASVCRNVNILSNLIFKNKGLSIDLGHNGATENDEGDADVGANTSLNYPELISAVLNGHQLNVVLRLGIDHLSGIVQFFSDSSEKDPRGYSQGELFIGQAEVARSPGSDQTVTLDLPLNFDFTKLKRISATVTVEGIFGPGTSELSKSIPAVLPIDFGDASDPSEGTAAGNYQTTEQDSGAYHVFSDDLLLGSCVDADSMSSQNTDADADDENMSTLRSGVCKADGNDEDGITFPGPIVAGAMNRMNVTNKGSGLLAVWMDYNNDGDFLDDQEQVIYVGINEGSHNISFFVPSNVFGLRYLRARLMPYGADISSTGGCVGGEVEDYRVRIFPSDAMEKTEAFKQKWLPNPEVPKK